jgi:hypothetical protein
MQSREEIIWLYTHTHFKILKTDIRDNKTHRYP